MNYDFNGMSAILCLMSSYCYALNKLISTITKIKSLTETVTLSYLNATFLLARNN